MSTAGWREDSTTLQIIFAEIILHILMALVLFVDLQDAPVLMIGGRENLGLLTWQEDCREAAVTADHSADDQPVAAQTRLRFLPILVAADPHSSILRSAIIHGHSKQ